MELPNKIDAPENEPFWQNFDATLMVKMNEVIEYLRSKETRAPIHSSVKESEPAVPCPHTSYRTLRNGRLLCSDCKRFISKKK